MATKLPIVETFQSIQGEGAHAGRSAFFIRLASCKVGCSWCDTKESWSSQNYPLQTVDNLAKDTVIAKKQGASFLVITGGEPLHHDLTSLCEAIRNSTLSINKEHMPIHIETSGVDQLSGSPDWLTVSPKKHFPPKKEILKVCQEIKVVIHTKDDLQFAEEIAKIAMAQKETTSHQPLLFLQPGWGDKEGKNLTIEYIIRNSQWRLSLQTHKWLEID